jgi:hypothetical protein
MNLLRIANQSLLEDTGCIGIDNIRPDFTFIKIQPVLLLAINYSDRFYQPFNQFIQSQPSTHFLGDLIVKAPV